MTFKVNVTQIIPADAVIVKDLFQKAITEDAVIYSRRGCALLAAACSAVNVLGFGILMGSRLISALIHVKFDILPQLVHDSNNLRNSIYATAAITACVFASLLTSRISFEPVAAIPAKPIEPIRVKAPEPVEPINLHQIVLALPVYTFAEATQKSVFLKAVDAENAGKEKVWKQHVINGFVVPYYAKSVVGINPTWICIEIGNIGKFIVPSDDPAIASLLRTGILHPKGTPSTQPQLVPPSPVKSAPVREKDKDSILRELRAVFRETYQGAAARHAVPPKDQLFRHYLDEVRTSYGPEFAIDTANIQALPASPVVTACQNLERALTQPRDYDDAQNQYIGFVALLRQAAELITPETPEVCRKFISQLSYLRYAGVRVYDWACRFVTVASGPLPAHLSVENFHTEFGERNGLHNPKNLPPGLSMSAWERTTAKMRGFFNRGFDPLRDRNLPYVDGILTLQGKNIEILRHGVPVSHNETLVAAAATRGLHKAATWLASWVISKPEQYIGKTLFEADKPQHNIDHRFFIRHAAALGKRILHVIFEDADVHVTGDESARVDFRLSLQEEENFFPLALRMDGAFFKTHSKLSRSQFKEAFKQQLFGDLGATGFCIPPKVRQGADLDNNIDRLLKEVEDLYFNPDAPLDSSFVFVHDAFKDLDTQKAFMLLSYAHIVLFLADKLDISILEAHCKDDIDRGNTFKAILKLHSLYLTGQLNQEQLEKVLLQTLIPPLIVKRQGIIRGRASFINIVHRVLLDAFKRTPAPRLDTPIVGTYRVHRPGDRVQNQDLFPLGHTAKTGPEYLDFLSHLKLEKSWALPGFAGNFIDDRAAGPAFAQRSGIEHQVARDIPTLPMYIGGERLKDGEFNKILPYLQSKGLSEEESWKVLCSFNQALSTETFIRLEAVFNSTELEVHALQDAHEMLNNPEAGIHLEAKDGVANFKFNFFARLVDGTGTVVHRMKATCTIPDHKTGVPAFEFSIVH